MPSSAFEFHRHVLYDGDDRCCAVIIEALLKNDDLPVPWKCIVRGVNEIAVILAVPVRKMCPNTSYRTVAERASNSRTAPDEPPCPVSFHGHSDDNPSFHLIDGCATFGARSSGRKRTASPLTRAESGSTAV
jgi:hypothetical protein